ncbi:MAG: hypothetical protein WC792_02405 [Candidatus Micrarchaeia archaeon]
MILPNPYAHDYKRLMVLPLVLLALSVVSLLFLFPLKPGVDLKGGLLLQIQTNDANPDVAGLPAALAPFSEDVSVRVFDSPLGGKGVEVELGNSKALEDAGTALADLHSLNDRYSSAQLMLLSARQSTETVDAAKIAQLESEVSSLSAGIVAKAQDVVRGSGSLEIVPSDADAAVLLAERVFSESREGHVDKVLGVARNFVSVREYSVNEVGSSLSKFFLKRATDVVLWSFLLSSIVVFLVFRSIVPSLAVIFGAVADITITAAAMGVLGIPISLASIAALLMLIGFSLDTDVMLTMRVLKRSEGTPSHRAFEAMKTGVVMNFCTIAAFAVLLGLSVVLNIPTYFQIGAVAVIGGFADFFATWCFNAVLILNHAEKIEKKRMGLRG